MNTYTAGDAVAGAGEEGREWVFDALASPGTRERTEQLSQLELRRRPDCEPCLQSLVTDEWTAETQHHLGWCDSCRAAAIALGPGVRAAAPRRRRALWLAVAAGVVILVPLAGSHLIDDSHTRGGVAEAVKQPPVKPVPRSRSGGASGSARGAVAVGVGVKASAGGKASGAGAKGSNGSQVVAGSQSSTGSKSVSGSKSSTGSKASAGGKAVVGGKVVVGAKHQATPLAKPSHRVLPLTT